MGKDRRSPASPGALVDRYFLEEKNPYSKRRLIKMKALLWVSGSLLGLFVIVVLVYGGGSETKNQAGAKPDFQSPAQSSVSATNQGVSVGQGKPQGSSFGGSGVFGTSLGSGGMGGARSTPTRSANQVIRRGAGGNDPGAALPIGHGIAVKLLNAILSTDSASPVIAEVTDDVYTHGMLSIPATTRVIGAAQYDESSRRIQLKFQTFVYPDGDQHNVQALGMMPDGSAGLAGDYHSGEAKRQLGRFFGHFIGGMAEGMKERKSGGQLGLSYEPGSLKNGILNGVTLSAEDQAKSYTDDLNGTKPFMTLAPGQTFVLFLEREYVP